MSKCGEVLALFGETGFDPHPLKRAITLAIKNSRHSRQQIADLISGFLGRNVTIHEVNTWTATSKTSYLPRADELQGLVAITRDAGLLAALAAPAGLTVVGAADAELLEIARLEEQRAEIDQSLAKLRGLRSGRRP